MTGYRAFLHDTLSDSVNGPGHAKVLCDIAEAIISAQRLVELTGNDPDGMDDAIDAQLDILIAHSNGDIRLALFATLSGLGSALTALKGPRQPRRT